METTMHRLVEATKELLNVLEEARIQLAQAGIEEKSTHWDEYVIEAIETLKEAESHV